MMASRHESQPPPLQPRPQLQQSSYLNSSSSSTSAPPLATKPSYPLPPRPNQQYSQQQHQQQHQQQQPQPQQQQHRQNSHYQVQQPPLPSLQLQLQSSYQQQHQQYQPQTVYQPQQQQQQRQQVHRQPYLTQQQILEQQKEKEEQLKQQQQLQLEQEQKRQRKLYKKQLQQQQQAEQQRRQQQAIQQQQMAEAQMQKLVMMQKMEQQQKAEREQQQQQQQHQQQQQQQQHQQQQQQQQHQQQQQQLQQQQPVHPFHHQGEISQQEHQQYLHQQLQKQQQIQEEREQENYPQPRPRRKASPPNNGGNQQGVMDSNRNSMNNSRRGSRLLTAPQTREDGPLVDLMPIEFSHKIIMSCIEEIKLRGLKHKHLFRNAFNRPVVEAMIELQTDPKRRNLFTVKMMRIDTVAGLLATSLSRTYPPLIPVHIQEMFQNPNGCFFFELLGLLPELNRYLFVEILDLCCDLVDNGADNQISPSKLAVCPGTCCFGVDEHMPTWDSRYLMNADLKKFSASFYHTIYAYREERDLSEDELQAKLDAREVQQEQERIQELERVYGKKGAAAMLRMEARIAQGLPAESPTKSPEIKEISLYADRKERVVADDAISVLDIQMDDDSVVPQSNLETVAEDDENQSERTTMEMNSADDTKDLKKSISMGTLSSAASSSGSGSASASAGSPPRFNPALSRSMTLKLFPVSPGDIFGISRHAIKQRELQEFLAVAMLPIKKKQKGSTAQRKHKRQKKQMQLIRKQQSQYPVVHPIPRPLTTSQHYQHQQHQQQAHEVQLHASSVRRQRTRKLRKQLEVYRSQGLSVEEAMAEREKDIRKRRREKTKLRAREARRALRAANVALAAEAAAAAAEVAQQEQAKKQEIMAKDDTLQVSLEEAEVLEACDYLDDQELEDYLALVGMTMKEVEDIRARAAAIALSKVTREIVSAQIPMVSMADGALTSSTSAPKMSRSRAASISAIKFRSMVDEQEAYDFAVSSTSRSRAVSMVGLIPSPSVPMSFAPAETLAAEEADRAVAKMTHRSTRARSYSATVNKFKHASMIEEPARTRARAGSLAAVQLSGTESAPIHIPPVPTIKRSSVAVVAAMAAASNTAKVAKAATAAAAAAAAASASGEMSSESSSPAVSATKVTQERRPSHPRLAHMTSMDLLIKNANFVGDGDLRMYPSRPTTRAPSPEEMSHGGILAAAAAAVMATTPLFDKNSPPITPMPVVGNISIQEEIHVMTDDVEKETVQPRTMLSPVPAKSIAQVEVIPAKSHVHVVAQVDAARKQQEQAKLQAKQSEQDARMLAQEERRQRIKEHQSIKQSQPAASGSTLARRVTLAERRQQVKDHQIRQKANEEELHRVQQVKEEQARQMAQEEKQHQVQMAKDLETRRLAQEALKQERIREQNELYQKEQEQQRQQQAIDLGYKQLALEEQARQKVTHAQQYQVLVQADQIRQQRLLELQTLEQNLKHQQALLAKQNQAQAQKRQDDEARELILQQKLEEQHVRRQQLQERQLETQRRLEQELQQKLREQELLGRQLEEQVEKEHALHEQQLREQHSRVLQLDQQALQEKREIKQKEQMLIDQQKQQIKAQEQELREKQLQEQRMLDFQSRQRRQSQLREEQAKLHELREQHRREQEQRQELHSQELRLQQLEVAQREQQRQKQLVEQQQFQARELERQQKLREQQRLQKERDQQLQLHIQDQQQQRIAEMKRQQEILEKDRQYQREQQLAMQQQVQQEQELKLRMLDQQRQLQLQQLKELQPKAMISPTFKNRSVLVFDDGEVVEDVPETLAIQEHERRMTEQMVAQEDEDAELRELLASMTEAERLEFMRMSTSGKDIAAVNNVIAASSSPKKMSPRMANLQARRPRTSSNLSQSGFFSG